MVFRHKTLSVRTDHRAVDCTGTAPHHIKSAPHRTKSAPHHIKSAPHRTKSAPAGRTRTDEISSKMPYFAVWPAMLVCKHT